MQAKLTHLIEQVSQGRAPKSVLDAMLDEVPDTQEIARDVSRELQSRGLSCQVQASKKEPNVVYVLLEEKNQAADAVLEIFESAYEGVQFVYDRWTR
jgi:hypothetical protein